MISQLAKKNQFNSQTWIVKLSPLFHIFIHKINNENFYFEFKESRFLGYKKHFTNTYNNDIENSISFFFEEINNFFLKNNKIELDFEKFQLAKYNLMLYFNNNHNEMIGNTYTEDEKALIKCISFYKDKQFFKIYDFLKNKENLLLVNVDLLLLYIESNLNLINLNDKTSYRHYDNAENNIIDLTVLLMDAKIILNENQQKKFTELKSKLFHIKIPSPIIDNEENYYIEPIGKSPSYKTQKSGDKSYYAAINEMSMGDINKAYDILTKEPEVDIKILLLLAKISIVAKKTDEIPYRIIAVINERKNYDLSQEQEIEFQQLLNEYKKINNL